MRRRGKRELAALLTVALLAGSAACGADAGEKDAATGTAEAAAGQDTETAAGQGTDALTEKHRRTWKRRRCL